MLLDAEIDKLANMRAVYIETSIPSYLTARPSRDIRTAAWQQITTQWWKQEKPKYDLYTSVLVLAEASAGDPDAAQRRVKSLKDIPELALTDDTKALAALLINEGGIPVHAEADALHIAIACIHEIDYLLTWNCRHIDNASRKPVIRSICAGAGYTCPEICTPLELLSEET